MLSLMRLDLDKLGCADRSLLREQLAQLVESDDLLIFLEALEFFLLLLFDRFDVLVFARPDLVDAVADTLVERAALEACAGRAEVLMLEWLRLRLDRILDRVLARAGFRLGSRGERFELCF